MNNNYVLGNVISLSMLISLFMAQADKVESNRFPGVLISLSQLVHPVWSQERRKGGQ